MDYDKREILLKNIIVNARFKRVMRQPHRLDPIAPKRIRPLK